MSRQIIRQIEEGQLKLTAEEAELLFLDIILKEAVDAPDIVVNFLNAVRN